MQNRLRELIEGPTLPYGIVMTSIDTKIVEYVAAAGFDYIVFEMTHSIIDLATLRNHVWAARACGLATLVRTPGIDVPLILRIREIAPDAVFAPNVQTAEDAKAMVLASRYPALGRGLARSRNQEILVGVMIEDKSAADEIEAIAQIPGLDFVFIGVHDLAASMNLFGTSGDPSVRAAFDSVVSVCTRERLPWGTFASHPTLPIPTSELRRLGASLAHVGVDLYLLHGALATLNSEARK